MDTQYLHQWSDTHTLIAAQPVATDLQRVLLFAPPGAIADTLMTFLGEAGYTAHHVESLDAAVTMLQDSADPPCVAIIQPTIRGPAIGTSINTLRAAASPSLRVLLVGDEQREIVIGQSKAYEGTADGYVDLPLRAAKVIRQVEGQIRTAQDIYDLETSRATLLGTAILSMELTQSLRTDLDAQRVLHTEVLHRVQTHIGALRDYLELEVRRLPLGIAREAMRGVLYRVRSLSAMYETMATLEMEDPVEFGQLASKISHGVKAIYSPRSKLPVIIEGQLMLSADSASPLTLVVNELVTNAYRHAFPGGRFGTIRITCGRSDEGGWCEVADDGVGMDGAPPRPHGGIQIIRQLVRRSLGGTCTWESIGTGTVARVQFPLANP